MYCEGKLKLMSHNTGRYTLYPGADRGFQVRGGGCKICWGISCEKSRFPILGDTCAVCTPPGSATAILRVYSRTWKKKNTSYCLIEVVTKAGLTVQ